MKLSDYLTQEGETITSFAKRIERSTSTVSRLVRGLTDPDGATVRRIAEATNNKVQPNDFYSDENAIEGGPRQPEPSPPDELQKAS